MERVANLRLRTGVFLRGTRAGGFADGGVGVVGEEFEVRLGGASAMGGEQTLEGIWGFRQDAEGVCSGGGDAMAELECFCF